MLTHEQHHSAAADLACADSLPEELETEDDICVGGHVV